MTTPPDRREPTVELTVAPPRGLEVHVDRDDHGDGPFRVTALTRTVVGLHVHRSWRRPVGRLFWWPAVASVAATFAAIVAIGTVGVVVVNWLLGACAVGTVAAIVAEKTRGTRKRRLELLAIEHETGTLVVAGLPPIRLADVEAVEVFPRLEEYPPGRKITSHELRVHDVVITTRAGKLLVAITETEEQACHVRDLIAAARRRLPGPG